MIYEKWESIFPNDHAQTKDALRYRYATPVDSTLDENA